MIHYIFRKKFYVKIGGRAIREASAFSSIECSVDVDLGEDGPTMSRYQENPKFEITAAEDHSEILACFPHPKIAEAAKKVQVNAAAGQSQSSSASASESADQ